jgi:hypothetical protein
MGESYLVNIQDIKSVSNVFLNGPLTALGPTPVPIVGVFEVSGATFTGLTPPPAPIPVTVTGTTTEQPTASPVTLTLTLCVVGRMVYGSLGGILQTLAVPSVFLAPGLVPLAFRPTVAQRAYFPTETTDDSVLDETGSVLVGTNGDVTIGTANGPFEPSLFGGWQTTSFSYLI